MNIINLTNIKIKECRVCGELKFSDEFHKSLTAKDGLYYCCKKCKNKIRRQQYRDNIEREKKRVRAYYIKYGKNRNKKAVKASSILQTAKINNWIIKLKWDYKNPIYLFPSPQNPSVHLTANTPRKQLRRIKQELGLTCRINPHAWRDFINTERFDKDLNVKYIFGN